jgi:hypothetical protein
MSAAGEFDSPQGRTMRPHLLQRVLIDNAQGQLSNRVSQLSDQQKVSVK